MDFRLTAVHDTLLRGNEQVPFGLYHLHLLTAEQVTRLYYSPASLKYVQKQLRQLVDHGYLQSDSKLTKRGTGTHYYTLGIQGFNYLRKAGLDIHNSFRASKEIDKSALFLEHTLELNDVLISAAKISQADARYHLHDLVHDRLLKRAPFEVKVRGHTVRLIPDAFLDFRRGNQRLPLYLEHDRSSEQEQHFKRRIRVYIEWVKSGSYRERFGASVVTVAFTTFMGEKRLQQMRQWTIEELGEDISRMAQLFAFAALPPAPTPQVWLSPYWYLATPSHAGALLAV